MYNKKTISPVVATALLLIVAVVAVVGFQNWFGAYSSGTFNNVETKSTSVNSNSIKIDILNKNTLYVINNDKDNISINKLEIGGIECLLNTNLSLGMNELDISDCITNVSTSTSDIVLITDNSILEKTIFIKNTIVTPTDPITYDNIVNDSYNNLHWVKKMDSSGFLEWSIVANSSYPAPTWDSITHTYDYAGIGRVKSDYPAFEYCEDMILDGFDDWRMPTLQELGDLNNHVVGGTGETNFINYGFTDYLPVISSSNESDSAGRWYRHFDGWDQFLQKTDGLYVLCTRDE